MSNMSTVLNRRIAAGLGLATFLSALTVGNVLSASEQEVGTFTAVRGQVAVTHTGAPASMPPSLRDPVLFRDLIETQQKSYTKALLNDDSLLTVGEHSRVEITEHIYDPARESRSVIINLLKGKIRALVNKVFTSSDSRFEVRTPDAVAAARGTYFVVWFHNGTSGIANIGTHGRVDFTSGDFTVGVEPGHFTLADTGAPPLVPSAFVRNNVPAQVRAAVFGTQFQGGSAPETPGRAVEALSGAILVDPPAGPPGLGAQGHNTAGENQGTGFGVDEIPPGHEGGSPGNSENSQGVGIGVTGVAPGLGGPGVNVTPPAVISGSAANAPGFGVRGRRGPPPGVGGGPPPGVGGGPPPGVGGGPPPGVGGGPPPGGGGGPPPGVPVP